MSNHRTRYANMIVKRHELLEDLVTHIIKHLVELELNPEVADLCANSAADMLCDLWGGQNILIPFDYARKLSIKEVEVYNYVYTDKHTTSEAAKHFKMGERGVNKLLRRLEKRIKAQSKGEPSLF